MDTHIKLIAVIIFLLLLSSCNQQSAKTQELEDRISELENQLSELKTEISINELIKNFDDVAYLTPGTDGYSLVKSDLGKITVMIDNVKPYANGSRITLRFGNLTSATIDGLKAKLEWGAVDKDGKPKNEEAKSRDVEFKKSLKAGSWTQDDVVLEGIPPTELGFVRLKNVGHRGIRLIR